MRCQIYKINYIYNKRVNTAGFAWRWAQRITAFGARSTTKKDYFLITVVFHVILMMDVCNKTNSFVRLRQRR